MSTPRHWLRKFRFRSRGAATPIALEPDAEMTLQDNHPGSQPSPPDDSDKDTLVQWIKLTLQASEKALKMVPVARLDSIRCTDVLCALSYALTYFDYSRDIKIFHQ